jgi:hypothetical protein
MTFAVITSVAAHATSGNLANEIDLFVEGSDGSWVRLMDLEPHLNLAWKIRTPVFYPGEILILNEGGREHGFPGRKPDKWHVEYEEFATVEEAIDRANIVMRENV